MKLTYKKTIRYKLLHNQSCSLDASFYHFATCLIHGKACCDPLVEGLCTKLHSFCAADVFNLSSPCCLCRRSTWR